MMMMRQQKQQVDVIEMRNNKRFKARNAVDAGNKLPIQISNYENKQQHMAFGVSRPPGVTPDDRQTAAHQFSK
jgi:hypothetical protein